MILQNQKVERLNEMREARIRAENEKKERAV